MLVRIDATVQTPQAAAGVGSEQCDPPTVSQLEFCKLGIQAEFANPRTHCRSRNNTLSEYIIGCCLKHTAVWAVGSSSLACKAVEAFFFSCIERHTPAVVPQE
jgi:hypothetical protein